MTDETFLLLIDWNIAKVTTNFCIMSFGVCKFYQFPHKINVKPIHFNFYDDKLLYFVVLLLIKLARTFGKSLNLMFKPFFDFIDSNVCWEILLKKLKWRSYSEVRYTWTAYVSGPACWVIAFNCLIKIWNVRSCTSSIFSDS